jgi:hypothetical protein
LASGLPALKCAECVCQSRKLGFAREDLVQIEIGFERIVAHCNSVSALSSQFLTESGEIQFNPRRIERGT